MTHHIIVTGGLAAGKTHLVNKLISRGGLWVVGSPATTMKRSLANCVARTYNFPGISDHGWELYFTEMMTGNKEEYRGLLQGYGEHFSRKDNFFWIRRVMAEVMIDIEDARYASPLRFDAAVNTTYDSIRRPHEIIGVRHVFPDAIRVHLNINPARQIDYLTHVKGQTEEEAIATLAHSSEHWLDDLVEQPDFLLDANYGDEFVWQQMEGILGKG